MPYVKNSSFVSGAKDTLEITSINIDMEHRSAHIVLLFATHDQSGIPKVSTKAVVLRDEDELILDPNWNSMSNPPKPVNFDINDPATWGSILEAQIPWVINSDKQFFSKMAGTDPSGTNIYSRLKNGLYSALASAKLIPDSTEGWAIQ